MISSFYDIRNFLSNLNGKKVSNAYQLVRSFMKSRRKGMSLHQGLPFALSIEPTTSCNLRCPECISGLRAFTRPTGMLDLDLYQDIIDELKEYLIYLTLYFQGEPYLHPSFFDMVQYASSRNIYTATSTNAHYLDQENAEKTVASGLDRLIISLDGIEQETYKKYRIGGQIDKVKEGIRNLVQAREKLNKKTPYIILQFIVFRHNEHEIETVKKQGKLLGVDKVAIKTAQIYDYENKKELIPENPKYSRYEAKNTSIQIKNSLENECWKMWHSSVVTWDGKVVPCCFDKDADHTLGTIQNGTSFSNIWKSTPYQNFRETLINSRSSIEMCKNCTEGSKIWA